MTNFPKNIQRYVAGICLVAIIATPFAYIDPKSAEAQGTVPINTSFNYHSIMDNLKTFTLDRLAVMAANQILQKMTASVVNWINTGFQGNPSFLTDPEGFFMDIGDQLTGQFLYELGVPGVVCEPFSLDLRIGIALNQANGYMPRYTCTLGTIVGNTMNAIERGPSVEIVNDPYGLRLGDLLNPSADMLGNPDVVSINNAGMNEFMRGDFRYGGWPGFLVMTMNPQNNPNAAYLQAEADLEARIAARRSQVNQDLNRGSGFLSWEKCENVTMGDMQSDYGITQSEMSTLGRNGTVDVNRNNQRSTVKRTTNAKTGAVSYQSCQTKTPGSIIGGSLQRQLNVPQDKLVLVKTISDSIDAILGALVNQMLTQGLATLSNRGSGYGGKSYLQTLSAEADSRNSTDARLTRERLKETSNSFVATASTTMRIYDSAISNLNEVKAEYITVQACYETKVQALADTPANEVARNYGLAQISITSSKIFNDVDASIEIYRKKRERINDEIERFNTAANSLAGNSSTMTLTPEYINNRFDAVEEIVDTSARASRRSANLTQAATSERDEINAEISELRAHAQTMQEECQGFPGNVPSQRTF